VPELAAGDQTLASVSISPLRSFPAVRSRSLGRN
jgi:hypothetical protein